jgi:hypothetical protein
MSYEESLQVSIEAESIGLKVDRYFSAATKTWVVRVQFKNRLQIVTSMSQWK